MFLLCGQLMAPACQEADKRQKSVRNKKRQEAYMMTFVSARTQDSLFFSIYNQIDVCTTRGFRHAGNPKPSALSYAVRSCDNSIPDQRVDDLHVKIYYLYKYCKLLILFTYVLCIRTEIVFPKEC